MQTPNTIHIVSAYASHPGFNYLLEYIFNERLGIEFKICKDAPVNENVPVLYYGSSIHPFIHCSELFAEYNGKLLIQKMKNAVATGKGRQLKLFPLNDNLLGFDVFAAVFTLLSRAEEYDCQTRDAHGRFSSKDSILFRHECLDYPIVDFWVLMLKEYLDTLYPELIFKEEEFEIQNSFDIDKAYLWKGEKWWYVPLKTAKMLANFRLKELSQFTQHVLHYADPYDTFQWIFSHCECPLIFFLMADSTHADPNLPWDSRLQKQAINTCKKAMIGIHPSYFSSENESLITKEKNRLEEIWHAKIVDSRQHYLRFNIPETYQWLENAHIENDYSLGFADHSGFRAGTSRSFLFFDLQKMKTSTLRIHPIAVMDVSLKNYMNLNAEEAILLLKQLITNVEQVNGRFLWLWHNESVSDYAEWKGWRKVFTEGLTFANSLMHDH